MKCYPVLYRVSKKPWQRIPDPYKPLSTMEYHVRVVLPLLDCIETRTCAMIKNLLACFTQGNRKLPSHRRIVRYWLPKKGSHCVWKESRFIIWEQQQQQQQQEAIFPSIISNWIYTVFLVLLPTFQNKKLSGKTSLSRWVQKHPEKNERRIFLRRFVVPVNWNLRWCRWDF